MIIYNDKVNVIVPITDDVGNQIKDDYGRPKTEKKLTTAHVRYNIKNIYDTRGEHFSSTAQVYIPISDVVQTLDLNSRVEHITPTGTKEIGAIKRIEYGQDITGKAYFIKGYI